MNTRRYASTGVLVVAVAALVRLVAASNEIWLDEVWSLGIATDLPSAWRIFTLRHGNNHILNTLYLRSLGLRDAWFLYRLPAVLTGTGTVALVLACERRERRLEALATAGFMALAYPLVLYSAEARGYAPALFCALASFYAVERYWERPRPAPLAVLWASAVIGVLSHAIYLQAYAALLGWSALRARRLDGGSARAIRAFAACHAVPLAVATSFYLFFVRGMIVDPGPGYRTFDVVREAAAYTLGIPQEAGTTALAGVVGLGLTGLLVLARQRAPRWSFLALVLTVVPALVLVVTRPPVLYFRYFLIQILFFYLLAGAVVGGLARGGPLGRIAGCALALLFVGAQVAPLRMLLMTGRGGCVDAVRYLGTHTDGAEVSVGSDEEFRSPLMLWYLQRFLPAGRHIRYVTRAEWPAGGDPGRAGQSLRPRHRLPMRRRQAVVLVDLPARAYPVRRAPRARSISRRSSFSLIAARLSWSFFPRPSPSSILARPFSQ
jgi:hypothetical protein